MPVINRCVQRFRKLYIRIQGSQVVATPRSDDPECCLDRTQYFRNRSSATISCGVSYCTVRLTVTELVVW
jgi:hypothetical protein